MKTANAAPGAAFVLVASLALPSPAFADSPPDPVQAALEEALSTPTPPSPQAGIPDIQKALEAALRAETLPAAKPEKPAAPAQTPQTPAPAVRTEAPNPPVSPVQPARTSVAKTPSTAAEKPTEKREEDHGILESLAVGGGVLLLLGFIAAGWPFSEEPHRRENRGNARRPSPGGGRDRHGGDGGWRDVLETIIDALGDIGDGFGGDGGCGDISSAQQVRRPVPGGPPMLMP